MAIKINRKKRKNATHQKRHIGEIRKSQLMNTFGVGSMVDFVRETAIIGGVDSWDQDDDCEYRKICNENLQSLTGVNYFLEPKTSDGDRYLPANQDIKSFIFPEKLYCPVCKNIIGYHEMVANNSRYRCKLSHDGKECKGRLVASRFVVICPNGHIDDFPYPGGCIREVNVKPEKCLRE